MVIKVSMEHAERIKAVRSCGLHSSSEAGWWDPGSQHARVTRGKPGLMGRMG